MIILEGCYCCDESLTPRVRTIFRTPPPASAPPDQSEQPGQPNWPELAHAILVSLFPFADAYRAAIQVIKDYASLLPAALPAQPTG